MTESSSPTSECGDCAWAYARRILKTLRFNPMTWHCAPIDFGELVFTFAPPSVMLFCSGDDRRNTGEIAAACGIIGIEHSLSGADHPLSAVALLYPIGFNHRLVWTTTDSTRAYSPALVSSALGSLMLRPAPAEAGVPLSIVLVAGDALHRRQTLARRWPARVRVAARYAIGSVAPFRSWDRVVAVFG